MQDKKTPSAKPRSAPVLSKKAATSPVKEKQTAKKVVKTAKSEATPKKASSSKKGGAPAWLSFLIGTNRPTTPASIVLVVLWNNIKDIEAFKAVAEATVVVSGKELGTRFYTYSYSDDNKQCVTMDGYSNIAALQQHLQNVSSLVPELLNLATPMSFIVQCDNADDVPPLKQLLPQAVVVNVQNGVRK